MRKPPIAFTSGDDSSSALSKRMPSGYSWRAGPSLFSPPMRTIVRGASRANAGAQPSTAQRASAARTLPCIDDAAKADPRGAVLRGRHQQVLAVLVELIGLWEVPVRGLRQVGASAAQRRGARVLVDELVGPLPHVADEGHHPQPARAPRMRVDVGGPPPPAPPALPPPVGRRPARAPPGEAPPRAP